MFICPSALTKFRPELRTKLIKLKSTKFRQNSGVNKNKDVNRIKGKKHLINGPIITISRITQQSLVVIALESLTYSISSEKLENLMDRLTTLAVESFFKGMRTDHDMPRVLQYAYRRAWCVKDNMLRIYRKIFSYFTRPNSYCPD